MRLVPYKNAVRYLELGEQFSTYDIVSEQQTEVMMQAFAKNRWSFPMMLYFESYPFEKEDILNHSLPVQHVTSTKKIISFSLKGFHHEPLPAFMVNIENEGILEQVFEEFFYVAEQNLFFALTNEQEQNVTICSNRAEWLIADYDGQGAIFLTTEAINVT